MQWGGVPPPEAAHMRGICEAYARHMPGHMPHRGRRICPQCLLETGEFNQYQPRCSCPQRKLEDMLALPDDQRQANSFLCQGEGLFHAPLAFAAFGDPKTVPLDMNNAPPDRFHGIVDMIDDLLGVVRKGMKHKKVAQVCPQA